MSSGRGSASGAASAPSRSIPSSAQRLVQTVKEVVAGNSEDDIYSMLKECNMDLGQTVQRLLNQDPFHEVKRKKDKKREGAIKENADGRVRSANIGIPSRSGRSSGSYDRNAGGNSYPRQGANELNGGYGKSFPIKENGIHPSGRAVSVPVNSSLPAGAAGVLKVSRPVTSSAPETTGSSFVLQNGSFPQVRKVSGPQMAWVATSSGNSTMAEIVKASSPLPPTLPTAAPVHMASLPLPADCIGPSATTLSTSSVSAGIYSSFSDPVLQRPLDAHLSSSPGAMQKGVGTLGTQLAVGDGRSPVSYSLDGSSISASGQVKTPGTIAIINEQDNEMKAAAGKSPVSVSRPLAQNVVVSVPLTEVSPSIEEQSFESGAPAVPNSLPSHTGIISSHFNNRHPYQHQQPPVGTKKSIGAGLEWKPKSMGQVALVSTSPMTASSETVSSDTTRSPPPSNPDQINASPSPKSKFEGLSVRDDQPVIMPNHLQRNEADHCQLSFGSFGAGFSASFSTNLSSEESLRSPVKESSAAAEHAVEVTPSSVVSSGPVSLSQSYISNEETVQAENSSPINADANVSLLGHIVSQSDVSRPGAILQGPYPYLPTVPSYPGFGLVPQIPGGQFSFEPPDALIADIPRHSNLLQPYPDPATSYYTPFRPISDLESRYPPFFSSKVIGKYNNNMTLVAGQSSPPQESGNSMVLSSAVSASQTSPTSSIQAVPTIPQQFPIHAYAAHPAGVPLGRFTNVFGYQYVPPNYPHLHTPYQHNFPGSGGYPQPAAGNNYASLGNPYHTGTSLALKYPLTQYKPSSSPVNTHAATAAGFGSYSTSPSGFASNPTVTIGTASAYEEVVAPQYKENNIYIPSQQAEGSTIWVQTQLSRDIAAAGMQASSYYNLPGQGQHSPYAHAHAHAQQHAHTLPTGAYAHVYHASQAAPTPIAHHLIQQHALGTGGTGGSQGGAYQQARGQQNWTNNY